MTDEPQDKLAKPNPSLSQEVGAKAARKLKARRNSAQGVWFGLGMMGLIGWSVVIPTLLGAALGIWLDQHYPGKHAWTLALMMAGLAIGCLMRGIGWPRKTRRFGTNRRITMNEFLFLAPPLAAGYCSARFSSAAFGGRLSGRFVSTAGALVLRQHAAADEHYPGGILFCRARELAAVAAVSPWLCPGTPGREVADPPAGRTPRRAGTGDQLCALVPMR
jgi:ATP synthase protein I